MNENGDTTLLDMDGNGRGSITVSLQECDEKYDTSMATTMSWSTSATKKREGNYLGNIYILKRIEINNRKKVSVEEPGLLEDIGAPL